LLLGADATESRFKTDAGGYQFLHLATHGYFDRINPLLSGVELERDDWNDGLLQVHEVLGLRLRSSLVTLSACETALGGGHFTDLPNGDEFIGMSRAFLTAGSAAVMAALWPVDDQASVTVMKRFYSELDKAGSHEGSALALAEAQRGLRSTGSLQHPFYWAAYVVVGPMNRNQNQQALSSGRTS
jgi:CHAT domain-containing protein